MHLQNYLTCFVMMVFRLCKFFSPPLPWEFVTTVGRIECVGPVGSRKEKIVENSIHQWQKFFKWRSCPVLFKWRSCKDGDPVLFFLCDIGMLCGVWLIIRRVCVWPSCTTGLQKNMWFTSSIFIGNSLPCFERQNDLSNLLTMLISF